MAGRSHQAGFSAVEVLIALFIAAAFVTIGYQLYSVVAINSAQTRQQAKASNIAYDQLQRSAAVVSTCSTTTVSQNIDPSTVDTSGLNNVRITVLTSAPYGCEVTPAVLLVKVTVAYGGASPQDEVSHAIYASQQ